MMNLLYSFEAPSHRNKRNNCVLQIDFSPEITRRGEYGRGLLVQKKEEKESQIVSVGTLCYGLFV